jgi:hypothetical protein
MRLLTIVALVGATGIVLLCLRTRSQRVNTAATDVADSPSSPVMRPPKHVSLSGVVVGAVGGRPVVAAVTLVPTPRAEVTFDASVIATVVCGADGTWQFDDLVPGEYLVSASAPGHLTESSAVEIRSAEQPADLMLRLKAGGVQVNGRVSDGDGVGIAGARVIARGEVDKTLAVVLTGLQGDYSLSLSPDRYRLEASYENYTSSTRDVGIARESVHVDLVLLPAVTVSGVVRSRDSNSPVASIRVRVTDQVAEIFTDDEGKFEIRQVEAGQLALEAYGNGYSSADPVIEHAEPGERVGPVTIFVEPAATVAGRVVNAHDPTQTLENVTVVAYDSMGNAFRSRGATDDSGRFEISGLRPGPYLITSSKSDLLPTSREVLVGESDIQDLLLAVSMGSTIRGRIRPPMVAQIALGAVPRMREGNPLLFEAALSRRTVTDAQGGFVIANVPPGSFLVTALATDGNSGTVQVVVGDQDVGGLVVEMMVSGAIAGRIADPEGTPLGSVEILAIPAASPAYIDPLPRRSFSGNQGEFSIAGLQSGKYDLLAIADEARPKKVATVQLARAEQLRGLELVLEARRAAIEGVVIRNNRPVSNARVRGFRTREDGPARLEVTPDTRTDAAGRFSLERLRVGNYVLVAESPAGDARAELSNVKTGNTDVTIRLASLGTMTIRVTKGGEVVRERCRLSCVGPVGESPKLTTMVDGLATFKALRPGDYDCAIECDTGVARSTISVGDRSIEAVVELQDWVNVTGTAVDVFNKVPVAGLSFAIGHTSGVTDDHGQFIAKTSPGGHELMFFAKGQPTYGIQTRTFDTGARKQMDLGRVEVLAPRIGRPGTFGFVAIARGDVLVVTSVSSAGPAERVSLRVGDEITLIEGRAVSDIGNALAARIIAPGNRTVGDTIRLGLRDREVTLTATGW